MKNTLMLWFSIPLLNTLQQIFLKLSAAAAPANFGETWFLNLVSSPWFILAITAEIACFVLWLRILAEFDLAKAFPMSAISYVFVLASAWLFFAEPVSALQLTGSALILAGVWCVSTASK
jgi:multidrug transporter EmrE-like cation transporter